ncbi:MAG: DoxX family protein [Verrucomicrobia bacterium]|nr:DoxX family protein [Verrucomicrobiota bacterium]
MKTALILFSALSFLGYGLGCFFSSYFQQEFRRYQLSAQCKLVGILQCSASFGLVAGFREPRLGQAAAAGLALMMLVALGVRLRIRDSLLQMLPALGYLGLNAYLYFAGF